MTKWYILMAEQVFAGRHRCGIEFRQRSLQLEIEGIASLLIPEQRIVAQHPGVRDRGLKIEPAVGVDGEPRLAPDLFQNSLDTHTVLRDRRAADLHLDDIVTAIEIAAHLAAQHRQALARVIIAAGGVDEYARVRDA